MRETIDERTVIVDEDIPEFSLDVNDLKELDALANKLGYSLKLRGAAYKNSTITGTPSQVMEKFSQVTDRISLPIINFDRKKDMGVDSLFEGTSISAYSRTVSIRRKIDKREEAILLLSTIMGFLSMRAKTLGPNEAPLVLYLRPRETLEPTKKPAAKAPDQAAVLQNAIDSKLRKLVRNLPTDEDDVQNAIENILIVRDYEYHREIERVPSGSKSTIPDFTIDEFGIALEAKLCKKPEDERRILEEINSDISTYQTKYPKILFVVYDIAIIRDMHRFGNEIRSKPGIYLSVVKH